MTYCIRGVICLAAGLIGISSAAAQSPQAVRHSTKKPADFPSPAKVQETVSNYLENLPNRDENDLLSRRDVTPLFAVLKKIGWEVGDRREIEQRLLSDSDWLVRKLRTKKGTRFMREMSSFPGGYDRLDRMRQLPQGKKELQGLIDTPGGSKLIEYLTTTKQGRRTGAGLSSSRNRGSYSRGRFNAPTDRLYTKADVFKQIKLIYAAEAARRLQTTSVRSNGPSPVKPARPKQTRQKSGPTTAEPESASTEE